MEDIAHALSNICRFNGHTAQYYSVAHHCLNVEMFLQQKDYSKKIRLYGLLHDAAEIYICDIPRPLKKTMPAYEAVEVAIQSAIYEHFNLEWPSHDEEKAIEEADNYVLALEAKKFMTNARGWNLPLSKAADIYTLQDECWKNGVKYYYYYRVSILLDELGVGLSDNYRL